MKCKVIVLLALCAVANTHAKVDERVICALGEKLAPALPDRLRIPSQSIGSVLYLVTAAEKTLQLEYNRNLYATLQEFYHALKVYGTEEMKRSLPPSVSALEREHVSNVIWDLFRYKSADSYNDGTQKTPFRPPLAKALLVLCEVEVHSASSTVDTKRAFLEIQTDLQQVFSSEAKRLEAQKVIPVEDIRELVTLFDVYLRQFQESWVSPSFLWRASRSAGIMLGMLSTLRLLLKLNNVASNLAGATSTGHVAVWEAKRALANINNLFARTNNPNERPAEELRGGIFKLRDQLLGLKGNIEKVVNPLKHWVSDGQPGELKEEDRGKIKYLLEDMRKGFLRIHSDTLPQLSATLATFRERTRQGLRANIEAIDPVPHDLFFNIVAEQPLPPPTPERRRPSVDSRIPVDGPPPVENGGGLLSMIGLGKKVTIKARAQENE